MSTPGIPSARRSRGSGRTRPGSTQPASRRCRSRSWTPGSAGRTPSWWTRSASTRESCRCPSTPTASDCASYNCNGDGAFSVSDYADDPRVSDSAGDDTSDTGGPNADSFLDPSDLIATFSNGADGDANGYVDDIAGWDFFDDDNDPYDASSCCSANGHGSGRAKEALAQTNNGAGETGLCPKCQLDAAADLGHVRAAHRQLGACPHLRRRQRCQRGGGRDRRADQHAVCAQRRALRGRQGHGADARLERHQQRQPQLPHQLQRARLRRRLVPGHGAQQHLHRARAACRGSGTCFQIRRRNSRRAASSSSRAWAASASPRPRSPSPRASSATPT